MSNIRMMIRSILLAIRQCRIYVITIFLTYCITCLAGIIMVHNGNNYALSYRDKIVGRALESDKASINYRKGNNFLAALNDFKGNLLLGAVPQTIMGIGIIVPYFTVSKQGWVGGIVSVNSWHKSRFKDFKSTFYYFFVLLLQFIPYSMTIGAGVKFGIDFYNFNKMHGWLLWKYQFQKRSLIDLGLVYLPAIPLFFAASCLEFLSTWNI